MCLAVIGDLQLLNTYTRRTRIEEIVEEYRSKKQSGLKGVISDQERCKKDSQAWQGMFYSKRLFRISILRRLLCGLIRPDEHDCNEIIALVKYGDTSYMLVKRRFLLSAAMYVLFIQTEREKMSHDRLCLLVPKRDDRLSIIADPQGDLCHVVHFHTRISSPSPIGLVLFKRSKERISNYIAFIHFNNSLVSLVKVCVYSQDTISEVYAEGAGMGGGRARPDIVANAYGLLELFYRVA
ncbi:hypothetical protein Tco_0184051 [Tanacetum coccineum]